MNELPLLKTRPRASVLPIIGFATSWLLLFTVSVMAEPTAEHDQTTPSDSAKTSSEDRTDNDDSKSADKISKTDIETAVPLQCEKQHYQVYIFEDGRVFFNPNAADIKVTTDQTDTDETVKAGNEEADDLIHKLQPVGLAEALNPTKTTIQCHTSHFDLRTSPPFSNLLIVHRFRIQDDQPVLVSRKEYDPTELLLSEAAHLAIAGNRAAIDSLDLSTIDFAYQYVNADRIHHLLARANKACDRQPCKATVETVFLLITKLSAAVSGSERDANDPVQWLFALDDLAVSMSDASPLLLRYVGALRQIHRHDSAIAIITEILRRDDQSADLHLMYADLLYDQHRTEDAIAEYRIFAKLIAKDGKTPPQRVARFLAD